MGRMCSCKSAMYVGRDWKSPYCCWLASRVPEEKEDKLSDTDAVPKLTSQLIARKVHGTEQSNSRRDSIPSSEWELFRLPIFYEIAMVYTRRRLSLVLAGGSFHSFTELVTNHRPTHNSFVRFAQPRQINLILTFIGDRLAVLLSLRIAVCWRFRCGGCMYRMLCRSVVLGTRT